MCGAIGASGESAQSHVEGGENRAGEKNLLTGENRAGEKGENRADWKNLLSVAGQHKLRGFLATSLHFELFSLRAYFKVLRQKVPYFNVLRHIVPYLNVSQQKLLVFN